MTDETKTPVLDELTERINKIKSLLDDDEPGLFMWKDALNREMNNLVKWWTE